MVCSLTRRVNAMALEEQLITVSLTNTFHEAQKVLQKLYDLGPRSVQEADEPSEEFQQNDYFLSYYVENAFRDVGVLAERLGLPLLRKEITKARENIDSLTDVTVLPDDFTFNSPPLQIARDYFESLQTLTQGRDITGLGIFENIFHNAGTIVKELRIKPKNEKDVRDCLRKVLSFAFPDVVKEIPLEKALKTYRPDIGVTSLMAAAEVKFVTTKEEAKAAIDGIYSDMKGYSGRDDWRSFYAVIYMTEPFYSQKDVERDFRLVKAELSWTPFVVIGPGARARKAVPSRKK
jgi:REase_DpnII-MboI